MLRRVFKAFQYRDFRILWFGACTSSIGTWMQEIAQNWLVLEITKSPFLLGLDAFLGDIPIFLFSLFGGVIADRMDRRHLLIGSQLVQMSSAVTLALLIVTGRIQIWHILVSSFVVGTAQAFGGPAYSALVPSLVEKEDLPNAIALNSIQFNLARVIGPVLGGLALKYVGSAWCFGLNALSFVAVIISLLSLNINFKPARTGESIMTSMKQGFRFIRTQGAMETLIVIAFLMTALAIPMITFLPVFAKDVFRKDEITYTAFLVASGLGSITGALSVAAMGNIANKGRIALTMLVALGAGISGFALSTSISLSCVILFVSGAVLMCAFAMISSLVQLITTNDMRGRVMSVYNVAFRGGMPFGSLLTGYLVPLWTAPVVLSINGIVLLSVGLYFLLVQRRVAAL
ncbi:MAG TPA: MFS transporter [Bryobacteraceae bacterium]|nr:MFS transporter [Bryobacteraceae bacterium]